MPSGENTLRNALCVAGFRHRWPHVPRRAPRPITSRVATAGADARRPAPAAPPRAGAALDFQEDIKADRNALAAAKRLKSGEKMSDASAAALRRKVGGTKSGFFGETVDVKGKYVEQGYVSSKGTEVAYLPFIVLVGASPASRGACKLAWR